MRSGWTRRRLAASLGSAMLAAALAVGLLPGSAAAIDPIVGVPIPDERLGDTLPGQHMQAMTFDLDGDGNRELVTAGTAPDAPGIAAVRAWWIDADGHAAASNPIHVRRAASVDEKLTQRGTLGIDRDGMVAVKIAEGSPLFVARRDGQAHLFVGGEGMPDDGSTPCCLTIWEVAAGSEHSIELTLVANPSTSATQLEVADLDGDGTDEIFVIEGPWSWEGDVAPPLETALLRWDGRRFVRRAMTVELPAGPALTVNSGPAAIADTDGRPGDDLLFTEWDPIAESPRLVRLTLRGDELHAEASGLGDQFGLPYAVDVEGGPAIVTSDGSSTLQLWRWPADRSMEMEATRITGGDPRAIFGTGSQARIVAGTGCCPTGSVVVVAGDLGDGAGPRTEFTRDARSSAIPADVLQTLSPWEGVVRDGLPGIPEAYAFSGVLVFPVADPIRLAASQPAPLMLGIRPVGTAGPGNAWEVLAPNDQEGHYDPQSTPGIVWMGGQASPGVLWLVAAEELKRSEVNEGQLAPTFRGAAVDPRSSDLEQVLMVGSEAVYADVTGPPGTVVHFLTRGISDGSAVIPPSGTLAIRLLDAASPDAPNGSGTNARLWAVTPAGHVYGGVWRLRVYRSPPDLDLTIPEGIFAFEPTIAGSTSPGARVTINGVPAEVSPTGSFRLPVDAGILPTEFRIVATDPVDNATVRVTSLVWPIDYRRLPFVPIAVVVTVVAGLLLYLRKPVSDPRRRAPEDDATFEEIGG